MVHLLIKSPTATPHGVGIEDLHLTAAVGNEDPTSRLRTGVKLNLGAGIPQMKQAVVDLQVETRSRSQSTLFQTTTPPGLGITIEVKA